MVYFKRKNIFSFSKAEIKDLAISTLAIALIFAWNSRGFPTFATFIAPGAVYIYKDYLTSEENGLISIAGPLTNVALAFVFLILHIPIISDIGYMVNIFLAAFNMIPIYPLDGAKVLNWNPVIWAVVAIPLFLSVLGVL
ncbi:MAG: hypothetical protein PWQ47_1389 [Methanothermococcus sp.]|nr:hypothetical protein [Methanothermococcus sp.]